MSITLTDTGHTFYAPRFEIKLRGQNLDRAVIRDVLDVTYTDSLDKLDSFEFTLHDWDPATRQPKFSSPLDESGAPRKIGDRIAPSFDPGAKIELYVGYYPDDPQLMMTGQIVSLSPTFPASGPPTLQVRALSLLHTLQKKQTVQPFEDKKDSEIAEAIARDLGVEIEIPPGQAATEEVNDYVLVNNEYPIIFLMGRSRRRGYDMFVQLPESGEPRLFFGRSPSGSAAYELEWGKSLVQFTPTIKTKGQVSKVTVRGWNPNATGDDRVITGEATWDDLENFELPDQSLRSAVDDSLTESEEILVDDPITSEQEAKEKAKGILRNIVDSLVTGQGATVGLPNLRSGRGLVLKGLGTRYNGRYLVTETTHKIGGGGYTTEFTARMEGPA